MIYFIGAGVGSVDYLLMKSVKIIRKADIILHSLHIDKSIFALAKKSCKVVPFSNMERMQVDLFLKVNQSKKIVYLVNGDVPFFGTLQDHIDFCENNNIPYTIVPGVSAVSAASAVIGRELVLPNISQCAIITYLDGDGCILDNQKIEKLASIGATLIFYMVDSDLYRKLSERLVKGGYSEDTPVVIVKNLLKRDESCIFTRIKNMGNISIDYWNTLILVGWVFADIKKRNEISKLPYITGFRRAEMFNLNKG